MYSTAQWIAWRRLQICKALFSSDFCDMLSTRAASKPCRRQAVCFSRSEILGLVRKFAQGLVSTQHPAALCPVWTLTLLASRCWPLFSHHNSLIMQLCTRPVAYVLMQQDLEWDAMMGHQKRLPQAGSLLNTSRAKFLIDWHLTRWGALGDSTLSRRGT